MKSWLVLRICEMNGDTSEATSLGRNRHDCLFVYSTNTMFEVIEALRIGGDGDVYRPM